MKNKSQALILCTGNSCRSQMAEALINHRFGDDWQACSAGTKPAGYVHPKAIQVLSEVCIDHQGHSKHVDQFKGMDFDLVVTVCDSAAEDCPIWLGKGKKVHHSFPDPAKASGTEAEILSVFSSVRDSIAEFMQMTLSQVKE